jgi:hypothetical protein
LLAAVVYSPDEEVAVLQFAVGLKLKSKAEHVIAEAEDALIAALR